MADDERGPSRRDEFVREILTEHAGARQQSVDEHMFDPQVEHAPRARFRLQLFTGPGLRPVALVTQNMGEGMSLTNGAERFVEAVWRIYCPAEAHPPVWFQNFVLDPEDPLPFQLVKFTVKGQHLVGSPRWGVGLTAAELGELVGTPVDVGRGRRQELAPEEPEPQPRFQSACVMLLPRPDAHADRACRPAGISLGRVIARQLWPRRGPLPCEPGASCWYHGGDWHTVSQAALRAMKQATIEGCTGDKQWLRAAALVEGEDLGDWEREAVRSLLMDPLQPNDERHWTNGRHRSQAMLEAGVHRTLVLRYPRS